MTVPAGFFGGGSDGAGWMESWLHDMCEGCANGREEGGMRGMGCELPARAYAEPHKDILEWSADASPPGPDVGGGRGSLRCMAYERPEPEPAPVPEGQLVLPVLP